MKVLIVHPQMEYYGGAEILIVSLSNILTEKGIYNELLTLSKSKEVEKDLKAKIIVPDNNVKISSSGFVSMKDLIKGIFVLRREVKKRFNDFDVIHLQNFPASWSLFPNKKPCVWWCNEPPSLWSKPDASVFLKLLNNLRKPVDRFIVRKSIDVICALDEFNQKRVMGRYGRDSTIIYCGIDYDFFSKGKAQNAIKKFNLEDKFVVIQSGVLNEIKNPLDSIKTVEKLKQKIPNILLVLAGKSDEKYEIILKDYIKKNKLEKYVLFTGNLLREDLRDLYKASDVGLFPIGLQGGWLAPFELLCAEKPIIVSTKISTSDLIKEKEVGVSTDNYADVVLDIFKNKDKYDKMAKNGALWVKENLSWISFTEKMTESFEKALNKKH